MRRTTFLCYVVGANGAGRLTWHILLFCNDFDSILLGKTRLLHEEDSTGFFKNQTTDKRQQVLHFAATITPMLQPTHRRRPKRSSRRRRRCRKGASFVTIPLTILLNSLSHIKSIVVGNFLCREIRAPNTDRRRAPCSSMSIISASCTVSLSLGHRIVWLFFSRGEFNRSIVTTTIATIRTYVRSLAMHEVDGVSMPSPVQMRCLSLHISLCSCNVFRAENKTKQKGHICARRSDLSDVKCPLIHC